MNQSEMQRVLESLSKASTATEAEIVLWRMRQIKAGA